MYNFPFSIPNKRSNKRLKNVSYLREPISAIYKLRIKIKKIESSGSIFVCIKKTGFRFVALEKYLNYFIFRRANCLLLEAPWKISLYFELTDSLSIFSSLLQLKFSF